MSTSVFIARLIGPVMLVIGLAVLTNQRAFREMAEEFLRSRALLFLSGLIIMPDGLAIVLTHNIWAADGRVVITLFGSLYLIAGRKQHNEQPRLHSRIEARRHDRPAAVVAQDLRRAR